MSWRTRFEQLLLGIMPYVFKGADGSKSILDEKEFYDQEDDGTTGARTYIEDEIEALLKKAFTLGFTLQAEYREVENGKFKEEKPDFIFSPDAGNYWSEKAWLKAKELLDS